MTPDDLSRFDALFRRPLRDDQLDLVARGVLYRVLAKDGANGIVKLVELMHATAREFADRRRQVSLSDPR